MSRKLFIIKLTGLVLVIACMFSVSTTAFAASSGVKDDPYGYTWLDESSDIWYFQYYRAPKGDGVYSVVDYAYLKGNTLYDANSKVISNSVRAMDDDPSLDTTPTVAYYNGNLYFLTTDGKLCKMTSSTATKYSASTTAPTAKYFTLDADGLGDKVGSKKLSSMSFSGSYDRGNNTTSGNVSNTTDKKGEFILTYAYPGDPLKVCYDAYENDKVILSIHCKNANVWNATHQILLSDTCVGAKFVGFSTNYDTILYDQDGTVYAFAYGNYEKAFPISLGEEIMSYKKDANGFVESITTSRKTYSLSELFEEYDYDDFVWADKFEYVKNTTSKSVAYDSDDEAIVTLKKSNNYLYFGDVKLAQSYKATYFGITENGNAAWINNEGDLYAFEHSTNTIYLVKRDVTRLRYDDNGFVYQYKVGTKTYALDY